MKVSIITICFNDRAGFERTAKSIVPQTFRDFEWIVIDGGSTDGSVDIQRQYLQHITHYVSEPDGGIYNAMNKGVSRANGEYCLFLNSGDCFCSPKALERVFKKNPVCDIVSCDMFVDINKRFYLYNEAPSKINFHRLVIGSIAHQSTLIRTLLLKETPYREDLKIASDWVFWCEMLLKRHKTYQAINIPLAIFDSNGISESPSSRERIITERRNNLSSYFGPELVNHIQANCNPLSALDGSYMYEIERKIHRLLYKTVMILFAYSIRDIIRDYKNLKYRAKGW